MMSKPDEKTQPAKKIQDLPPKPLSKNDEEATKGGVRGPGTQTEDDIYVG
jgi:hypothetical protein